MLKYALDYNKFLAELKQDNINEAKSGYSLNFVGKDYAKLKYGLATETVLKPDIEHNSKPENKDSENVFITGDNLDALKHLQNAYSGKIKMLYIDPPYNTGKEFVYNDKFEFSDEQLRNALNYTEEEVSRLKSLQGKSSHSAWLAFMYPRLKIAQKLLSEDGVIFISIDDNEQANLKLLCDEIFGEGNFVAQIVWQKKYAATNDSKGFSTTHDYILAFQKSESFNRNLLPRTEEQNKPYKNDDNDGKGLWRSDNLLVKTFSKNSVYPVINPNTKEEFYPPKGSSWRANKETMDIWIKENRVFFGKDGKGAPQLKRYLNEVQQGKVPITWWSYEDAGHNDSASRELGELFDSKTPFDTPKPTKLIKLILQIGSNKMGSDIILDFFAGSGTTAHAVTQLNSEDGGNRKFIMVQLDEPTKEDSEARKAGYNSIDEIARERIKRAGAGFKHYRCQEPPAQTIDKIEKFDPSKEVQGDLFGEMANAFGEETILQTWLLSDGYEFGQMPETKNFAGYRAHYIDGSLYIINQGWGKEQTKELLNLVGKNELRLNHIRLYGYSMGMESLRELKINVSQSLSNVEIELRY